MPGYHRLDAMHSARPGSSIDDPERGRYAHPRSSDADKEARRMNRAYGTLNLDSWNEGPSARTLRRQGTDPYGR